MPGEVSEAMIKKLFLILMLLFPCILIFSAHAFSIEEKELKQLFKLAEEGDVVTQVSLASMYRDGKGVPRDYDEAMKWLKKAAAQGDAVAQYSIALMHHNGEGVPQDFEKAMKWFKLAAMQGHVLAQLVLGDMYGNGEGIPQNYQKAYLWYSLASWQGNKSAKQNIAIITPEMTPSQIADARKEADELLEEIESISESSEDEW